MRKKKILTIVLVSTVIIVVAMIIASRCIYSNQKNVALDKIDKANRIIVSTHKGNVVITDKNVLNELKEIIKKMKYRNIHVFKDDCIDATTSVTIKFYDEGKYLDISFSGDYTSHYVYDYYDGNKLYYCVHKDDDMEKILSKFRK